MICPMRINQALSLPDQYLHNKYMNIASKIELKWQESCLMKADLAIANAGQLPVNSRGWSDFLILHQPLKILPSHLLSSQLYHSLPSWMGHIFLTRISTNTEVYCLIIFGSLCWWTSRQNKQKSNYYTGDDNWF